MSTDRAGRAVGVGPSPGEGFGADYEALRYGSGVVEIPREVLRVSGPDTIGYMQGQCSQDVASLSTGECADSLLLEPQGKLVALVRITRTGDQELLCDVAGGYGEMVRTRLERFRLRVAVAIETLEWRCVALRGAKSPSPAASGASAGVASVIAYSWGLLRGVDLLGPSPLVPEGVRTCSTEALESLRVESGIPEMGAELDGRTIAAEAGLLERAVNFTKGCYTGQELIARLDARGNRVARRLRGIVVHEAGGTAYARGDEVLVGEKVVGSLTSVAWSPSLGSPVALAYLHRDVVPPCPVVLRPASTSELSRPSLVPAGAVELPLVD